MSDAIFEKAKKVIAVLENNGFEAYMIGGYPRDRILGKASGDIDLTTNALPEEVERCFPQFPVLETGLRHGTVTVLYEDVPFEITTYRIDSSSADHRHPDAVRFSDSLREDCTRRDFTINAIAYHPVRGFVDFFGGREDLRNKIIRCIGRPSDRFEEDALRILRALRFSSTLDFEIDTETEKAIFEKKDLLRGVSRERIYAELRKLLCGSGVERVLLRYADVFSVLIPEIAPMKGFDQKNPHHCLDLLAHTARATANIPPKPHLRFAALLHDIGKPDCFSIGPDGIGHFYGHSTKSAEKAEEIFRALKADHDTRDRAVLLIRHHDTPIELREEIVKRRLRKLGEESFFDLILLMRADNLALAPEFSFRQKEYDALEAMAREILEREDCFSLGSLAVNGNDLIALGYRGKEIGNALESLLDAVLENRIENRKEALLLYLQKQKLPAGPGMTP